MFCPRCGFQTDSNFCSKCGTDLRNINVNNEGQQYYAQNPQPAQPVAVNPVTDVVNKGAKSGGMLAICILMSIACLFGFSGGGIPVLQVLYTIFLWIFYAKGRGNDITSEHIKNISGVIFADFILTLIGAGLYAVLGILMFALISSATNASDLFLEFMSEFKNVLPEELANEFNRLDFDTIVMIFVVLAVVFIIVGVVLLLFALLCIRPAHKTAKSLYISAMNGNFLIHKPQKAATALMTYGIIMAVLAGFTLFSGDILTVISSGVTAAIIIVGSIWIKKNLAIFDMGNTYNYISQNGEQDNYDF